MDKSNVVVFNNECSRCACSQVCKFKENLETINNHLKDDLEKKLLSNGEERFFTVSLNCKFYREYFPTQRMC